MATFLALDFETANHARDSACAIGLALCRDGALVERASFLIRPPSREFVFTYIHRLGWRDVCNAPDFAALWPTLAGYLNAADFLVAHNAPFDRGVLRACCARYGLTEPVQPFECTVRIARHFFGFRPARLPDVCARLDIALDHHEAGSDAEACARIVLAAQAAGWARTSRAADARSRA
ncbi:MAG: 3'-5' exonuclease [Gammaproteobacteria bacterium]